MGNWYIARVMQGDVNSLPGCLGVVGVEIEEWIKCRSRVRIQKCFPQPRLADFADRQILPPHSANNENLAPSSKS